MQSAHRFLRARRAVLSCLLAGVAAIGVSACGSSSSSSGSDPSSGTPVSSSSSAYQARLNYAKCMRSHGVNVPDPSANGGPAAGAAGGAGGGGGGGGFQTLRNNPNFKTASTACAQYRSKAFGFANITPAQRAQFQQDAVKFAECMRAHSINIPDPSSNGAGGFGIFRSIPSSERDSPQFKTAITACASDLPTRRGGGAGGPGGGPGGGAPGA
jgi:hypothetical protein